MDFLFWSMLVLGLVVIISLITAFAISLTVFLGPPDGFDIDVEDSPKTKESNYDSSKHKKTFR